MESFEVFSGSDRVNRGVFKQIKRDFYGLKGDFLGNWRDNEGKGGILGGNTGEEAFECRDQIADFFER